MSSNTNIEWVKSGDGTAGKTWNPIVGCSVTSPGCTNCYAMRMAARLERMGQARYAGTTRPSKAGAVWTGKLAFVESALTEPLRRRKPTTWFVNSMSDLFHESVPDAWIDRVFAVMALCPQHTFQVLTKRSARMRAYCARKDERGRHPCMTDAALMAATGRWNTPALDLRVWPLPNVWLGVSAEDQTRADERVPDLLATPAAVRWVSAEPLLGPWYPESTPKIAGGQFNCLASPVHDGLPRLDWVVAGGESGPNARAMHPAWAQTIRDQCAAQGVAFFFKQWGAWGPIDHSEGADEAGWQGRGEFRVLRSDGTPRVARGWPDESTGEAAVIRVGKRAAGRLLDGKLHDAMPEVSHA